MILRTVVDTRLFFGILFVVLVGFANAFYLVYRRTTVEWLSLGAALLSSYRMMFGDYETAVFADENEMFPRATEQAVFTVLFVLFLLVVVIILMNLLIAILSDTYTKVQENAENEWRLEQAKVIVEIETYFLRGRQLATLFPRWVQVLLPNHGLWFQKVAPTVASMQGTLNRRLDHVDTQLDALHELQQQNERIYTAVLSMQRNK